MLTRPVLLYDGNCAFCLRWVRRLERWGAGERIEMLAAGARGRHPELAGLTDAALDHAMHLVLPDGRTLAGGAAVPEVVRRIRRGWLVSWLFRLPGAGWATDRGYRWVAARRHRLGCSTDRNR